MVISNSFDEILCDPLIFGHASSLLLVNRLRDLSVVYGFRKSPKTLLNEFQAWSEKSGKQLSKIIALKF